MGNKYHQGAQIKAVADDSAAPRRDTPKPTTQSGRSGYLGDPDHDAKRHAQGMPVMPPDEKVPAGYHFTVPPEPPAPMRRPKGGEAMRRLFGRG